MENLSVSKSATEQTNMPNQITWDNLIKEGKKETTWEDIAKESRDNASNHSDTPSAQPETKASLKDVQELLDAPAEKLQDKAEKIEKRLRKKLQETYEYNTKREFDSLGYVSEAIRGAGLVNISDRIDDYNEATAKIDTELASGIVDYIDAKFSTDPKKSKEQDAIWGDYYKKTKNRATTLESTMGIVRSGLFYSGDKRLEGTAEQVSEIKSEIPEDQMRVLRAYKTYFDDPTKKNLKNLDDQVGTYISSVRGSLDRLTDNVALAVPNSDNLCYAIGIDLSRAVSKGRGDIHGAIIEYFRFKHDNYENTKNETVQEEQSATKATNKPTPRNSKMMSAEELREMII